MSSSFHTGGTGMLMNLAQWLQSISSELGFLRVFQYLTFRAVMAAMTALLLGPCGWSVCDSPSCGVERLASPYVAMACRRI